VVSEDDIDLLKGTRSRLATGSVLTRDELLLIALMASENRAASALGRTYPGGIEAFVVAMNAKARSIGMTETRFIDATGLSAGNVSSARDLARLVGAAHQYPLIREYSTRESAVVNAYGRELAYRNTNGLVRSHDWEIGLSKTGFISEAGRCLVMQMRVASRDLIVVLLDSAGKHSRIGDAQRIRKWLETSVSARRI
jgi:D-alanyl-D-alanine endopeptidase (penicillin-binding protein 7)